MLKGNFFEADFSNSDNNVTNDSSRSTLNIELGTTNFKGQNIES